MLAISRRPAEGVCIGTDIHATVLGLQDRKVQLGIQAPPELKIFLERPHGRGAAPVCQDADERRMSWLHCRPGEGLWIGDRIFVFVYWVKGRHVRLGIKAPDEVEILRDELVESAQGKLTRKARGLRPSKQGAVPC